MLSRTIFLTISLAIASVSGQSNDFVKVSGQKFILGNATYHVLGTNAYWLAQRSNQDIDKAFTDLAAAGVTTVRTWGFNDVTASSSSGAYYQVWSGKTGTVNTGANGLGKFDYVVSKAKANGIRLIVALTNNWGDYGGMDVYVKQIVGGNNHGDFYTNANVVSAFKKYIDAWIARYKNETGILAWELANEPRCRGSNSQAGSCNTSGSTITAWAKDISAYIKSNDPNHLVALGDEGFYQRSNPANYPYGANEGVNFDENLKIETLDFGTFHMYPDHWGQEKNVSAWGVGWIQDHAKAQQSANKPVVLEEFGSLNSQTSVYTAWYNAVLSSGLAGDLIWQAGSKMPGGTSHDDGFAVYPDGAIYPLMKAHIAAMKARP